MTAAHNSTAAAQQNPSIHPAPRAGVKNTLKSGSVKRINGKIVSLDIIANTIEVKNRKTARTFYADTQTLIEIAGRAAKLGDLKKNTNVEIRYNKTGNKWIATVIKQ